MSIVGLILVAVGLWIARAAYRSLVLAAQLGKLSEDRWQERADGDRPAPQFVCTQGCSCNPAPAFGSSSSHSGSNKP